MRGVLITKGGGARLFELQEDGVGGENGRESLFFLLLSLFASKNNLPAAKLKFAFGLLEEVV